MSNYARSQYLIYRRDYDMDERVGISIPTSALTSGTITTVNVPFDSLDFTPSFGMISGYASAHTDEDVLTGVAEKHSYFRGYFDDTEIVTLRWNLDPEGSPFFDRSTHIDDKIIVKQCCMNGTTPTVSEIEITNLGPTSGGWSFGIKSNMPSGATFNQSGLMIRLVVTLFAESRYKFGIYKPSDDPVEVDFDINATMLRWSGAVVDSPTDHIAPAIDTPYRNINGYIRDYSHVRHVELSATNGGGISYGACTQWSMVPTYGTTTPINPLQSLCFSIDQVFQFSFYGSIVENAGTNGTDESFLCTVSTPSDRRSFSLEWQGDIPSDSSANFIYLLVGGNLTCWSMVAETSTQPDDFRLTGGFIPSDPRPGWGPGGTYSSQDSNISIETVECVQRPTTGGHSITTTGIPWSSTDFHYPIRTVIGRNRNRNNFGDPFSIGVYHRTPSFYNGLGRIFGQTPSQHIQREDIPRALWFNNGGHLYNLISDPVLVDLSNKIGLITRSTPFIPRNVAYALFGFGTINQPRHTTQSSLTKRASISHIMSSRLNPVQVSTNEYEHSLNLITSTFNNITQTANSFLLYTRDRVHNTGSMKSIKLVQEHSMDGVAVSSNYVENTANSGLTGTMAKLAETNSLIFVTLDITHTINSLAMLRSQIVSTSSSLIYFTDSIEISLDSMVYRTNSLEQTTQSKIRDYKFGVSGEPKVGSVVETRIEVKRGPRKCINSTEAYYGN